jgi:hypothetical protein
MDSFNPFQSSVQFLITLSKITFVNAYSIAAGILTTPFSADPFALFFKPHAFCLLLLELYTALIPVESFSWTLSNSIFPYVIKSIHAYIEVQDPDISSKLGYLFRRLFWEILPTSHAIRLFESDPMLYSENNIDIGNLRFYLNTNNTISKQALSLFDFDLSVVLPYFDFLISNVLSGRIDPDSLAQIPLEHRSLINGPSLSLNDFVTNMFLMVTNHIIPETLPTLSGFAGNFGLFSLDLIEPSMQLYPYFMFFLFLGTLIKDRNAWHSTNGTGIMDGFDLTFQNKEFAADYLKEVATGVPHLQQILEIFLSSLCKLVKQYPVKTYRLSDSNKIRPFRSANLFSVYYHYVSAGDIRFLKSIFPIEADDNLKLNRDLNNTLLFAIMYEYFSNYVLHISLEVQKLILLILLNASADVKSPKETE